MRQRFTPGNLTVAREEDWAGCLVKREALYVG